MHMMSKMEFNTRRIGNSPSASTSHDSDHRLWVDRHNRGSCSLRERLGLDVFVTIQLLEDTQAVLFLVKPCEENGFSYEWEEGQIPNLIEHGKNCTWQVRELRRSCSIKGSTPFEISTIFSWKPQGLDSRWTRNEIDCRTCQNGQRNLRTLWWQHYQKILEVTADIFRNHLVQTLYQTRHRRGGTIRLLIFPQTQIVKYATVRTLR